MIYPDFPKTNDCIGICAPSAGVGHKTESFNMSLENLNNAGFRTIETPSVRNDACPSASPEIRAKEFNSLYENSDVTSVFCATGGDFLMEMLPYIDAELIKRNPKWFIGYSDPTSIETLLTSKYDMASIYGVNAGAFDSQPLQEFQDKAISIISGDIVTQHSYDKYNAVPFFISEEEGNPEDNFKPVDWRLYKFENGDWIKSSSLNIRGRLIGGCSDCIDGILGTPYEDFKGFIERYTADGIIWFFDPFEQDPIHLRQMIAKMKFMGLFDNAKLMIFGRVFLPHGHDDAEYIYHLQQVIPGIPFIWGADIGHTKPSMTLINGSIGKIEYSNGKAILNMELI